MAKKSGFFSWFNKDKSNSDKIDSEANVEPKIAPEEVVVDEEVSQSNQDTTTEIKQEVDTTVNELVQNVEDAPVEKTTEKTVEEIVPQIEELESELEPVVESSPAVEIVEPVTHVDETSDLLVGDAEQELEATEEPKPADEPETTPEPEAEQKLGFFERLKQGLTKTRLQIGGGFMSLFKGKKIDDELYEELETQLLMADVGMDTTVKLIDSLTEHADRHQLKDAEALYDLLKTEMSDILEKADKPLVIENPDGPFVILMVGVNGVGKTTTIGKMAKQFQQQGKSVMLAAGDTFRAAAVEQLQVWGERNNVPVVAQHTGADSASVIFDAYQAAKARNVDVLIADTAGRLQNKENLMQELEKIVRVLKKMDASVPHEVMLTIDATTGQNAMSQTKLFNEAVGLTGISLTKLDGSAKGGVIFSVANQFDIPIRFIGVGEGVDDLRTFEHKSFINALFD